LIRSAAFQEFHAAAHPADAEAPVTPAAVGWPCAAEPPAAPAVKPAIAAADATSSKCSRASRTTGAAPARPVPGRVRRWRGCSGAET